MMPGPPLPPNNPYHHPSRRQNEYHYQHGAPTHSPVHNPYAFHQPYHGHHPPLYAPQWYPPYQQPQYPLPLRPYNHQIPHQMLPLQQSQSPLVVSSHPHAQPVTPLTRPPFQPPPAQQINTPPLPAPSTPSITSQPALSPMTPTTSVEASTPPRPASRTMVSAPVPDPAAASAATAAPVVTRRMPYYPSLPWYSHPDESFPPRAPRRRRRRRPSQQPDRALELPSREESKDTEAAESTELRTEESLSSTVAAPSDLETPATSQAPSEADATVQMTPSSAAPQSSSTATPATGTHKRTQTKPAVPLLPVAPKTPAASTQRADKPPTTSAAAAVKDTPLATAPASSSDAAQSSDTAAAPATSPTTERAPETSPPKPTPKSWADLVRTSTTNSTRATTSHVNGVAAPNGAAANDGSLADVLRAFSVDSGSKISFLEPRGLVNTGNMCYMNSVLQILIFCTPFYDFLDQVGRRAVHSFKGETPLLDAMIMFMREFNVIDAAETVQKLKMRLKDPELDQYGEAFIPEYVYDVIKRLPRFASMRRGHQQDAEEFLGFVLDCLHDECAQVLKSVSSTASDTNEHASPVSERSTPADGGWLEVGPKQKASITRSSGHIVTESPITKIFGGKLRSELRVPGLKNSVTLEPYQPLQLDIGALHVNNITDALKGLTHSETLQGDFNSPRGPSVSATKQVFIENLPPVLILHLKRFQYDNTGGTQKIWKKIGYPLELTIPKEVFPSQKRGTFTANPGGLPKYRLVSVVYHHGKNASGGHYTVDVRRQDGKEWVRMDDTVIRRVRSEDVAEGGSEEDPKVLAKALEQHKRDSSRALKNANLFDQFSNPDEEPEDEKGWSQVNGAGAHGASKKKANGTTSPSTAGKRTPAAKDRVAYILFYQRI